MIQYLFRKKRHFSPADQLYLELFDSLNSDIYKVTVESVSPQKTLRLTAPEKGFRLVPLSKGEYIRCFYFKDSKMHEFYVPVLDRTSGQKPLVTIKYPSKIDTINRRRHERISCDLPTTLRILPIPHHNWIDQTGNIVDISIGGAKIKSKYALSKNQSIELGISLGSNKTKRIIGYIIDAKKSESYTIAHVAFVSLSDHERKQLCNLIQN